MTPAFTFDASGCSGCKACQAACKDKNNLPPGVLWRRNYEVGGGKWTRSGDAWTSTVYAYNLSIACNHCVHPKCAGVCPVNAYTVREDGIVLLDSSKCIGCGYCAWACPYGAPQYDRFTGKMTKCNLCYDNLDAGLAPACVTSCPLRVLDVADQAELERQGFRYQVIFPMPASSRTEPRVYIKPHPAAGRAGQTPEVLNQEEFAPQRKRSNSWAAWEEIPLLVFTLSAQMAAGMSWVLGILVLMGIPFSSLAYLAIGAVLGLGLIVSFLHLGSPKNAWRVFGNLHKSWLSREILAALLFMLCWAISILSFWLAPDLSMGQPVLAGVTSLAGAVLVFSMSEVYRLRMVPTWNTWHTKATFFLSAMILGVVSVLPSFLLKGSPAGELARSFHWILAAGTVAFVLELVLSLSEKWNSNPTARIIRMLLSVGGITGSALLVYSPADSWTGILCLVFLVALLEQILGRWFFYASRNPSM